MKKLMSLGFVLVCLASCSSDDDGPAVSLDNLQKRWYNVSTIVGGQTIPYDGNESCGKDYMEFQAAGVLKEVDVYDCQEDPDTTMGTYTASETTLTTVLEGETITYTIKELNASSLRVATTFNGAEITYVYTSTP
ncbi:MAG: lipocalin family protein [Bacteroidota bacterium]